PSNDGRYAIGADNRAYRVMADYEPGLSDYYLVNVSDGARRPIRQKQRFPISLSPGGKYAVYFDGKDWNSYSIADGRTAKLTRTFSTKRTTFRTRQGHTVSVAGRRTIAKSYSTIVMTSGKFPRMALAQRI